MQQSPESVSNTPILSDSNNAVTKKVTRFNIIHFNKIILDYVLDALRWLYRSTQGTIKSLPAPHTLQYNEYEAFLYIKMLLCIDAIKSAPHWEQWELIKTQSNSIAAYLLNSIDTAYTYINNGASIKRSVEKFSTAASRIQATNLTDVLNSETESDIRNRVSEEYIEAAKGRLGKVILMKIFALLTLIRRWPINYNSNSESEDIRIASKVIMDGYIQMINTLHMRVARVPDGPAKKSPEFNLSLLKAGKEKMAKTLLDLTAPKEAIHIYRAIGCHIDDTTPGWSSYRYYTRNNILTDEQWILSHSEGQGISTMEWRRLAGEKFTYTSRDGLGRLKVYDGAGVGSYITGAILMMPDHTLNDQSGWYKFLLHEEPLAQATLLNCSALRWAMLRGLQGARIISSFNQGNVHFNIGHTALPTNRPKFEMSLLDGVYSGSFGKVEFSDTTGKSSIFILSGPNNIEATGKNTLSGAIIFIENPEEFNLILKDGAGDRLLIISEQPFIKKIESIEHSPRILSPETFITAQDMVQISQGLYNRLPYIQNDYHPLFEEMSERRKSLASLNSMDYISLAQKWKLQLTTKDRLDTTLFFGGLEPEDRVILCSLFEQIEHEEWILFTAHVDFKAWGYTNEETIVRKRTAGNIIEKGRLESLERAVLEPIELSEEVLNTGLCNFFNPYTISAITNHPEQNPLYESLSKNAKSVLSEYLRQMSIEYPQATNTPDWAVFIRTFHFLRALGPKLSSAHWPSKVLFTEPITEQTNLKSPDSLITR